MSLTIAARREVFLSFFKMVATVCLFPFAAQTLAVQRPRENSQTCAIQRLGLVGNRSIRTETILARISSRPGKPGSVEVAQRDVRNLWDMQLFDDVRLEVEELT